MSPQQFPKATWYGLGLLAAAIFLLFYIPNETHDPVFSFIAVFVYLLLKLGALFYGQTVVKKLNRNYHTWPVFLYFCTSISLIVLGQLYKIRKEPFLLKLEPEAGSSNPNNFPTLTLGIASQLLVESARHDTFTIKHMLKNYKQYLDEHTELFPVLAAYELNSRKVLLDNDIIQQLDKFAGEYNYQSFHKCLTTSAE